MQARVDWVLIIFRTRVINNKQLVWPVFPGYLSVSYNYRFTDVYLKCLIFPILGLERFLELYGTLVNTFQDIYHNEE